MTLQAFRDTINSYHAAVGGDPLPNTSDVCNTPSAQPLSHISSTGEVKHLLKRLNTSTAAPPRDFPTWVSLHAMEDICLPLHNIINAMVTTREFLNTWKQA